MYKNPFTETLVVPYIRIIKANAPIAEEFMHPGDYYEVEQTKSTRLYRTRSHFELFKNMSVTGHRLFMWIMYHIPADAVSIKLDDKTLADQVFSCSHRTVMRARMELLKCAIIARKADNEYWTNPHIIASDSRLKLYEGNKVCVHTVREKLLN